MLKFIDYNNITSLTLNYDQNEVGDYLLNIYNDFGPISSIQDVCMFCIYIKNNFIHDSKMTKFERTSDEIAKSKIWSGCSDFGTLVSPILRMNNIPTVYVQSAHINWINEYQVKYEKLPIIGHIFLEVYVNNTWYLLDANNGRIYYGYNVDNCNLPNGLIAFSKSLNGQQVGCDTNENNRTIMENYFKNYDVSSYLEPKYECLNFFESYNNKK